MNQLRKEGIMLRPCEIPYYDSVKKEERTCKGLFHRFIDVYNVNHIETKALVERADGRVEAVNPTDVRFIDTRDILRETGVM